MVEWWMETPTEPARWMPSVLGLSPGEDTVTSRTSTSRQVSKVRWNLGLFRIVIPDTVTLAPWNTLTAYQQHVCNN